MYRISRQIRGSTSRLIMQHLLESVNHSAVTSSPTTTNVNIFYSLSSGCKTKRKLSAHAQQNNWLACQTRQAGTAQCTAPCRAVTSVALDHDAGILKVKWGDEEEMFPYVWLRDNCRCIACYHAGTHSRLTPIADIDFQAKPTIVKIVRGQEVEVIWKDGHRSEYDAEWLRVRSFSDASRRARQSCFRFERKYCTSKLLANLPKPSFQEVMEDDKALLDWLLQLEVYGFANVCRAPTETGQVRRLADRIGFINKTHYGEDFTVKAKPDASNLAYLSAPLQLHTDLPFYEYKPGVQFIHCISQYLGEGGDSLIADGVHVARELQKTSPEHYRVLTDTPVDWFDIGTDETGQFYKVFRNPVICLDQSGDIRDINMNEATRDSYFSVPVDKVHAWYKALATFHRLLHDPKNCFQFKALPGTIITFDNLRILHGRTGYMCNHGDRHMEGCYVNWDEVRSRRRVLENKLGQGPQVNI